MPNTLVAYMAFCQVKSRQMVMKWHHHSHHASSEIELKKECIHQTQRTHFFALGIIMSMSYRQLVTYPCPAPALLRT